jgi:hypothetical protein
MKKLDRVKQYLEDAVNGDDIGVHGNFWRDLDLAHFKTYVVPVHGGVPLLVVGNGANSNLIKALKGQPPFGAGQQFPRMPKGYPAMDPVRIEYIKTWIDGGCQDEDA